MMELTCDRCGCTFTVEEGSSDWLCFECWNQTMYEEEILLQEYEGVET